MKVAFTLILLNKIQCNPLSLEVTQQVNKVCNLFSLSRPLGEKSIGLRSRRPMSTLEDLLR